MAELGAVANEELQGSIAVGALVGDVGLDAGGILAADCLAVGWVILVTGIRLARRFCAKPLTFLPFLRLTYPMILRTQAGVCGVVVPAATTLARAMTATAKMDLLKIMLKIEG